MPSLAPAPRKRKKTPLKPDSILTCPAKKALTQVSQFQQSQSGTSSQPTANCITVDVKGGTGAINNNLCTIDLCTICKQLTSTTLVGTDSLKCCLCGLLFHGECLSVSSKNMLYLHIMVEIGGWCCARCRTPNPVLADAVVGRVDQNQNPSTGLHSNSISPVDLVEFKTDLESLKVNIRTMSDEIRKLTTNPRLFSDVVSSVSASGPSASSSSQPPTNSHVGESKIAMKKTIQSEIISFNRRSCNVVVSGLKEHDSMNDVGQFKDLCLTHLTMGVNVLSTKRLGAKKTGLIQPLLVQLENSNDASHLLRIARNLRSSMDPYVKQHVFINKHMSYAEREAAYQKRLDIRSGKLNSNGNSSTSKTRKDSPASDASDQNSISMDVVSPEQQTSSKPTVGPSH